MQFIEKWVDALVSMQRQVQVQEQIDGTVGAAVTTGVATLRKKGKSPTSSSVPREGGNTGSGAGPVREEL